MEKKRNSTFSNVFEEIQEHHEVNHHGNFVIYAKVNDGLPTTIKNTVSGSIKSGSEDVLLMIGKIAIRLRSKEELNNLTKAINKINNYAQESRNERDIFYTEDKMKVLKVFKDRGITFPEQLDEVLASSYFIEDELERDHSSIFLNEVNNL